MMVVQFHLSPFFNLQCRVMEAHGAHNPKEFVQIESLQKNFTMTYFDVFDNFSIDFIPLALGLFMIGIFGIILNNKNLLILMLNIELMFLGLCFLLLLISVNTNFFSAQIYTLIILSIAAAEAAIGLGLLIIAYKNRHSISFSTFNELKD
jgi:NADH-quinone oxidoreductase subunit K